MRLYRPVYFDADGRQRTSAVWWVDFADGPTRRVRKSLGVRDKAAAEQLAAKLVRGAERRRAGMTDAADEQAARPIADHVAEFAAVLAGRGVTERHRLDRVRALEAFVAATGARTLRDLDEARAAAWIEALAAERTRLGAARSARDVNRRIRALRQFAAWCVATRRVPFAPFPTLRPRNEGADRRHERRALTPDEATRLLVAAAARPLAFEDGRRVLKAVTAAKRAALAALGRERATLYATALYTALRRGELAALRWADVDLDAARLRVDARTAKARRERGADLRPDLVAALRTLRATRADPKPGDPVFRAAAFPTARGFALDLVAAGLARFADVTDGATRPAKRPIDTVDDRGLVVDFHALRVTAVTWAQAHAGASPREAQAIAGHARPDLTLSTYTDPALLDVRGVYERLPSVGLAALLEAPAGATVPSTVPPTVPYGSPSTAAGGLARPHGRGRGLRDVSPSAARNPTNPGDPHEGEGGACTWT